MLLSNLVEEKSNKVIEVLAAAVPLDAVFLGKLLAMLAMSLVGLLFWGVLAGAGYLLFQLIPSVPLPQGGRKCPECGAYALRKVDGCSHCSECHYIGSCG